MHLYLQRLEEAGLLMWYRLGHPGKDIVACNEYFTDYLTQLWGPATFLHYVKDRLPNSCGYSGSDLRGIAQQLLAERSPVNFPVWR